MTLKLKTVIFASKWQHERNNFHFLRIIEFSGNNFQYGREEQLDSNFPLCPRQSNNIKIKISYFYF